MDLLDDTHLEAARRGAMITAALKYVLDKIPAMLFPPQIRPGIMVLKRLTPYLGYVGVFIAWSWTAIKARDKGTFLPPRSEISIFERAMKATVSY
jgi:hypothetical protein